MIQNFNFSMKINKNNKLIMCKNKTKNTNNNNQIINQINRFFKNVKIIVFIK